ncbi:MAG: serine hydrolase, partial [Gemmatimonadetes bacterium]|nr:serine hydrolase [Gemmatimonadota bacterium]
PRTALRADEPPVALTSFIDRLREERRPVVAVSFGSPYFSAQLADAPGLVLAWGGDDASQRGAADALIGRTRISGRLPIALPPLYPKGHGLDRAPAVGAVASGSADIEIDPREAGMDPVALARVDRLLRAGTRDVAPGMAIAMGRAGRLVRLRAYGRLDWDPESPAATPSTLFDLASLTKVVGTTTAIMKLVDEGRLRLDSRIGEFLPEWDRGWMRVVTVRDLLLHRGGLPPFRPFWRTLRGREEYRRAIGELEADYRPGSQTVYSDIGLMTLAFTIETITGRPLDDHLERTVFGPLGMSDTGFNPSASVADRIAPTEMDTVFRGEHVAGVVHDENAFALGGVAGHAGLFSTARDLARFADWILAAAREGRGLVGPDARRADELPSPSIVAAFSDRAGPESSRALGWDTPSGRSSAGRFFGAGAFGHTGFTGTSIWIDPELDLFVVLLTNRVNPTRDNLGHIPFRRAVHDAVATAIVDRPVPPREPGP